MALTQRAVSAPGKVLLTGGYLVLDRKYTGLVFGLDARIHVHVQPLPTSDGVTLQEIIVKSPQFKYGNWRYGYRSVANGGGIEVTQLRAVSTNELPRNAFVETALAYALTYISMTSDTPLIAPSFITILADNDYYSQGIGCNEGTHRDIGYSFKTFDVPIWEAHKTGLGSSAALVTAFIAAVLSYYLSSERFDVSRDHAKQQLHNLAQVAHSAAQGKVGSGFDVASAVFGSCLYRRFSPSLLESPKNLGSPGYAPYLKALIDDLLPDKWDTEITKSAVGIPNGLRLVMCDVNCGSKTPGMVKQVLEWRKKSGAAAERLWSDLHAKNNELAAELVKLEMAQTPNYTALRNCLQEIRSYLREISAASGVPVEPQAQTKLLDACTQFSGVIGGVPPGAGGYDALALLIEDKDDVFVRLNAMLDSWQFEVEVDGVKRVGRVRLLGVRGEMEGIRIEDPASYKALETVRAN